MPAYYKRKFILGDIFLILRRTDRFFLVSPTSKNIIENIEINNNDINLYTIEFGMKRGIF